MTKGFYKHICKHYHLYSFIANMLNAVSMAGLALLGVGGVDTMPAAAHFIIQTHFDS